MVIPRFGHLRVFRSKTAPYKNYDHLREFEHGHFLGIGPTDEFGGLMLTTPFPGSIKRLNG